MAGGPIMPVSVAHPTNGKVRPAYWIGNTNSRMWEADACEASLGSDAVLELEFYAPKVLPTGAAKLRMEARANASSGNGVINPSWASVAVAENPDTISLNAEGNQTVTWSSGDADKIKELKVALDADTVVAGETIRMHLTFVSASWTLTAESYWKFSIIWE